MPLLLRFLTVKTDVKSLTNLEINKQNKFFVKKLGLLFYPYPLTKSRSIYGSSSFIEVTYD